MEVCVKMIVKGRVQGVGFRWFVQREADKLQVTGYVKNLANGNVEAVLQGEAERVEQLIERVRQGPSFSHVQEVQREPMTYKGKYESFEITF